MIKQNSQIANKWRKYIYEFVDSGIEDSDEVIREWAYDEVLTYDELGEELPRQITEEMEQWAREWEVLYG